MRIRLRARLWGIVAGSLVAAAVQAQEHDHRTVEEAGPAAGHAGDLHADLGRRPMSGTSWSPDDTPMLGVHARLGAWTLMAHAQVFGQFLYESGEVHRRSHQAGSVNWGMVMADRPAWGGRLLLRGMASAEPWTIPGCGYPDLLATGERCEGDTIHDRQHPHDLFMEVAAEYERPVSPRLRWHVYGGPVGEPALGPTAFLHRWSARGNPVAPISHHWIDSTHVTFGVLTSGVSSARWRLEASVFNGREPDEQRAGIERGRWDSHAARVSFMPSRQWVVQASAGRLTAAERHAGVPVDVVRATASASYHGRLWSRPWGGMAAWGANHEAGVRTHAVLVESTLGLHDDDGGWVFGRVEINGKPAHDLHVHEIAGVLTVGKLQTGYVRRLRSAAGLDLAIGVSLSGAVLPPRLVARYGGRVVPGAGVYLLAGPSSRP